MRRSAFTLVELLVVIGIIALLISILLPALSRARESANRVVCLSNQRQIYLAAASYAADFKGYFPGAPYTHRGSLFYAMYDNKDVGTAARYLFVNRYLRMSLEKADPNWSDSPMVFANSNGPMWCPSGSKRLEDVGDIWAHYDNWGWKVSSDFTFSGLGVAIYGNNDMAWPVRVAALGRRQAVFSFDTQAEDSTNIARNDGFNAFRWTKHFRSGKPQGMNVVFMDGSGTWIGRDQCRILTDWDAWYYKALIPADRPVTTHGALSGGRISGVKVYNHETSGNDPWITGGDMQLYGY